MYVYIFFKYTLCTPVRVGKSCSEKGLTKSHDGATKTLFL